MSEPRPTSELLSAIHGEDTRGLEEVTPVGGHGHPAAKHDMAMLVRIR